MNVGRNTLEVMQKANWYNRWTLDYIGNEIRGDILEIGAGIGNFTTLLSKRGNVTVIDYDKEYINLLNRFKGIKAGFGDIEKGKVFFNKKRKFDTIVCFNVLEHIKDERSATKNMLKLLKPGGCLIIIVPAHMLLYSEFDKAIGHYRRYTVKNVKYILQKVGFSKIDVRYINWWAAVGWFMLLRLTGWKKMPSSDVGVFDVFGRLFLWPERFIKLPFGLSVLAIARK